MKAFKFFVFVGCFLSAINTFAQSPKAIEADLLKSFKRIDYWVEKYRADTTGDISLTDSLETANEVFGKKLKFYTAKYSFMLSQKFNSFYHEQLGIINSADNRFRIYTWDTYTGGTMHVFENIIQYKSGSEVKSYLQKDTTENGNEYVYCYDKIYTLNTNNKTYYLGIYNGIFSNKDMGQGIQIFTIEDGKLGDNVKIIKTSNGLHSKLYYDYDLFTMPTKVKDADIYYDSSKKAISLPVIIGEGKVTNRRITYKFTGKYFERVK